MPPKDTRTHFTGHCEMQIRGASLHGRSAALRHPTIFSSSSSSSLDNPFNQRFDQILLESMIEKSRKLFISNVKIERLDSRFLLFLAEKKCYSQSCAIIAIS